MEFMPEKLVKYTDIARAVGDLILHGIFDQFRHETPSEHFVKAPETTRMATVEQDYDGNGSPVDWYREFKW